MALTMLFGCVKSQTNIPDNVQGVCKKGHMESVTLKSYYTEIPCEIHYWVCEEIDTTHK